MDTPGGIGQRKRLIQLRKILGRFGGNTFSNSEHYRIMTYARLKRISDGKEIVYINLAKKPFANVDIESLTSTDATSNTLILTIIPAAIVFICGTVIMVRRRFTR